MTEKELYARIENAKDGEMVILDKGKTYDVWSDDCIYKEGYHFSNTASYEENPKGFRPVALYAKGKKNLTIDGNGATVMVHGIMTPYLFDGCENLTLKNITFDYAVPTMSVFRIEKREGKECLLRVQDDCLYDVKDNRIIWHGERGKDGNYLWQSDYRDSMRLSMVKTPEKGWTQMLRHSDEYDSECRFPCVPEFEKIEEIGDRLLKVTLKHEEAYFPEGGIVESRNTVRDQIGGCFSRCKDVLAEHLTVRAMHGFGLLSEFCENVTFRDCDLTPKAGRTVVSNADFFQASGCKGVYKIERCKAAEGHDDYVNVHGTHLRIVEKEGSTVTARFMNLQSRGFQAFFEGDEIDFIDKNNLRPYGTATVKKVTQISDTDFILETDGGEKATIGDAIENVTWTPELIVKDNYFGPTTGRGILCTTRKKILIEGNTFEDTAGNVLTVEDDCNFWFESGYTTDLKFVRNKVIGCGYGSLGRGAVPIISVNPQVIDKSYKGYVHHDILIEGNEFSALPEGSYVLDVKWTENFVFRGNKCDKEMRVESFASNVTID